MTGRDPRGGFSLAHHRSARRRIVQSVVALALAVQCSISAVAVAKEHAGAP